MPTNRPETVEDECDSQKRFVAIYSQAVMEYISNNITDNDMSVRDAAHRTRKMLDKPSSVLGGNIRAFSSWVLSVIDQPIADVLRACPYSVRESECSLALSDLQSGRMKTCPNYSTNIAMYDRYKQFTNSCGFKQLFDDLLQHSANSANCDAIDFFMEAAAFKYKLLFLSTTACILKLCSGQCHADRADLNTKWRAADVLSQVAHDYYESLALGPDDANNNQKRFVSVYSRTLLLYMTNNKSSEAESITDAAHKAAKLLENPADVIAAPLRAAISLMMNTVEGPLTDVQVVCSYEVKEPECTSALNKLRSSKVKQCHGYTYNAEMYDFSVAFANSCGLRNLLDDLTRASFTGTDIEAIDLFTEFVSSKYTDTVRWFKNILIKMESVPETCNGLKFL